MKTHIPHNGPFGEMAACGAHGARVFSAELKYVTCEKCLRHEGYAGEEIRSGRINE